MGGKWIVKAKEHKVQEGDTIESLADKAGITWQQLALFNWGTDKPDEVNEHLRKVVGCYKLTEDGKNFKFTGKEDPGIVYIPEEFPGKALSLDSISTIKVKPVVKKTFVASNVMVEFRPKSDWKGEFGFDWLRIGDVGEEAYKKIIEGGYNINEDKIAGKTVAEVAYTKLKAEYRTIPTKVKNKAYRVPWLNLYPPSAKGTPQPPVSAELRIFVTVEGDKPPLKIEFDYNKNLFLLDKQELSDKAVGHKRVASDGTIKITCLEEFDVDQEIIVLAPETLKLNEPIPRAGKIILSANKRRKRIRIIIIKVRTKIDGLVSKTGIISTTQKKILSNILYQAFVYGIIKSGPLLDLSSDNNFKTGGIYIKNVDGIDYIHERHPNIFSYVKQEFFKNEEYKRKYEKDYITVFVFGEGSVNAGGRVEGIGVRNLFLFEARLESALAHEILHCLKLRHTHRNGKVESESKYLFPKGKTDNIMSYNPNRRSLLRWQWEIIRKSIK